VPLFGCTFLAAPDFNLALLPVTIFKQGRKLKTLSLSASVSQGKIPFLFAPISILAFRCQDHKR
jgi:hypothetical protein